MKDPYANFLIQFIFIKFETKLDEILPIIHKIEINKIQYCKTKYSSSVIEKCFERGNQMISEHILKYIINNHSNSLIDIINNPYGFYILKKVRFNNNKNLKESLMKIIVNNIDEINKLSNANKIITCFSSEYKEFSDLLYKKNKSIFKNVNNNK